MNNSEGFGCKRKHFIFLLRLQYSIYAGRHVVPGIEGLLLECTAEFFFICKSGVEPSRRAYVVINSQVDNQISCQHDKSLFLLK